ncbi:MAG: SUF system Fe-S cluster assembly regulator [Pseudomonadota bacterium]
MFKISKMTDYGTVVLAHLSDDENRPIAASEIAGQTGLGVATVSKLLKAMAHAGLVSARRGATGGYSLARSADDISAAEIIDAIEGPVAITECATDGHACELEPVCGVGSQWQQINTSIRRALSHISLTDLKGERSLPNEMPLLPIDQILHKDTLR